MNLCLRQGLFRAITQYIMAAPPPMVMDDLAQAAEDLVNNFNKAHSTTASRLIVGISGIPASGKSTFALTLTANINTLLQSSHVAAILVALDGWHLTRAQLDAFPDPQLAHDRRGIHWTFDGPSYLSFLHTLRADPVATTILTAPSFDHALKDPAPDAVVIHPYHRIVIIEGLYTFLNVEPWGEAGRMLDERWWVACEEGEARRRLVKRHVVTGVVANWEEAEKRADENDMPSECGECFVLLLTNQYSRW
jgi:pantothenate kinase